MSLILDGTNGLSDIDGSAATPAIRGTDANTGIFFPAADTIAFAEGGAEAMRLDSAGNVFIGATTGISKFEVTAATDVAEFIATDAGASGAQVNLFHNSASPANNDVTSLINFIGTDSAAQKTTYSRISGISTNVTNGSESGAIAFSTRNTGTFAERMRLDSSGNLGLGVTPSPWATYSVLQQANGSLASVGTQTQVIQNAYFDGSNMRYITSNGASRYGQDVFGGATHYWYNAPSGTAGNVITFTQAMTLDASGNLLVGKTALNNDVAGVQIHGVGIGSFTRSANIPLYVNRLTDDGTLVELSQAGVAEGTISVSGTTVSYNGGHLSRWAQTESAKDESLVKGTVLSNLDAMNVYTDADGNPVDNEQLNKVKVSDVEGDANVAGVFVNWTHDDQHDVDEINMAMTGDMIIRIAQGVTVVRGDLLMSAGDGTAKPQGDDIVRSKTVAKVTSNHVTCTYADGSYCVPCVLMAC